MPLILAAIICAFIYSTATPVLYAALGITFLVGFAVLNRPRVRRERERERSAVEAAFNEAYADLRPPPVIVTSTSYGHPAFEIRFRSKDEMETAAPRNAVFKAKIGEIFERVGSVLNPFDAEKAIFFTYEGYLEELRSRFGAARPSLSRTSGTAI